MTYEEDEATEYANSDQEARESLLSKTSSPSPIQSFSRSIWIKILIAEQILIVIALLIIWKTIIPTSANLQNQVLTDDDSISPTSSLTFEHLPCGNTPDQARARGCEFDLLITAWLPPRCIDYDLIDEFQALNWSYYDKEGGTEENKYNSSDPNFLGSLETTIYVPRSWHIKHCVYVVKKLYRALENGWQVDGATISQSHIHHCMQALITQIYDPLGGTEEIEGYLGISYPACSTSQNYHVDVHYP